MQEIIRKLEPSDLSEALSLIHKTTLESYRDYYPKEAMDYFLAYHSPEKFESDIKNGYAIAVCVETKIIGTGILLGPNIRRVFVSPEYQGQGYGASIMKHLEEKAKENGLDFVDLHSSLPSKEFYNNLGYKTLKFCQIPVENSKTLDYNRMAKMIRKPAAQPNRDLDNKQFTVIQNSGPGAELDKDTIFTFYQKDELVLGLYEGGKIKEGELIGFIDGEKFNFHYEQTNIHDETNTGWGKDTIEKTEDGRTRLVDTWKWESKKGEGFCIMEEIGKS